MGDGLMNFTTKLCVNMCFPPPVLFQQNLFQQLMKKTSKPILGNIFFNVNLFLALTDIIYNRPLVDHLFMTSPKKASTMFKGTKILRTMSFGHPKIVPSFLC